MINHGPDKVINCLPNARNLHKIIAIQNLKPITIQVDCTQYPFNNTFLNNRSWNLSLLLDRIREFLSSSGSQ